MFAFMGTLMIVAYTYLMVTMKRHFPEDKLKKEKIVTTISVGLFTFLFVVRGIFFWFYGNMWTIVCSEYARYMVIDWMPLVFDMMSFLPLLVL